MALLLLLIIYLIVFGTLAYGAISAAPWVPMKGRDINRLIELSKSKPGELIIDLGCGDGRILLKAVKEYGLRAAGYEVAMLPYMIARLKVLFVKNYNIQIYYKNFWQTDLSPADIVVCFLTPPAMRKLVNKLYKELKPGARFITYAFPLPGQTPQIVSKPSNKDISIYLYTKIVRPVGMSVDR